MPIMRYFFLFLLLCTNYLFSTERMPWIKTDLVLYPRLIVTDLTQPHEKRALFFQPGISASYTPWWGDLALTFANTHAHRGFQDVHLSVGYFLSNDIVGDPLSVLLGATYIAAAKGVLHDRDSFHHGRNELEAFVSFGKEITCGSSWSSHWWGVTAFGIADHGSPWARQQFFWEKNWEERVVLRFYVDGLWGLGHKDWHPHSFKGYGPIRHRSFEVGSRIVWISCDEIEASFEYGRRVYARNFPRNCNFFRLEIVYPYSL